MSALWAISSYREPHRGRLRRVSYEAGTAEVDRDVAAAAKRLAALGVRAGDRVLVCSRLSEAAQWWPFTIAPMIVGAQVSLADATRGDGRRVAMFCRQLDYRAVLGVTADVLAGLDDVGAEPAALFDGVEIVGAAPDAVARLDAIPGVHPMVTLGPTVALAEVAHGPLHVAADEWELGCTDGWATITARRRRATQFDRATTAVRGEVVGPAALRADPEPRPEPDEPDGADR